MNLRWKLRRGSGRLVVEMLGDFDETADLRDLVSVLRGRIAIDLGGVRRFSSAGVREWIHFVRSLPQGTDLSLVGCSTASVTQLNLIDNFRGNARVESFWAPYACVACGAECEVLLEDRDSGSSAGGAVGPLPVADSTAAFPIAAGSQAIPVLASSASISVASHPSGLGSSDTVPPLPADDAFDLDDSIPSVVPGIDDDDVASDTAVVAAAMTASSTTTGPIVARALPSPPPVHCDSCGHSMVLDELPQHYLLFLADRPVRLAERGRN